MEKINIWIYLKNGKVIELSAKEFTATRNQIGKLIGIDWILQDEYDKRPLFMNLNDISAIISKPYEEEENHDLSDTVK